MPIASPDLGRAVLSANQEMGTLRLAHPTCQTRNGDPVRQGFVLWERQAEFEAAILSLGFPEQEIAPGRARFLVPGARFKVPQVALNLAPSFN